MALPHQKQEKSSADNLNIGLYPASRCQWVDRVLFLSKAKGGGGRGRGHSVANTGLILPLSWQSCASETAHAGLLVSAPTRTATTLRGYLDGKQCRKLKWGRGSHCVSWQQGWQQSEVEVAILWERLKVSVVCFHMSFTHFQFRHVKNRVGPYIYCCLEFQPI